MIFGKTLLTTFTFAAMAITHIASAPTAQPEISIIERGDSITSKMNTCYNNVQYKCNDINKKIDDAEGVVDITLVANIQGDLEAIVDLIVAVVAEIKVAIKAGVTYDEINGCGTILVLLVKLLTSVLIKLGNACTPAALSLLAAVVLKLKVNIQLCASVLTGAIDGLISKLLGIVLTLLASLKVDITVCIKVFVGACSKYA